MNKTFLLFILLCLIACGKDNKSGVPEAQTQQDTYSPMSEDTFRQNYIGRGNEILNEYDETIRALMGEEILRRMRQNLAAGNFSFSYHLLTDYRGQYTSSYVRNGVLYIYWGDQDQSIHWNRRFSVKKRSKQLDRQVLHELLELSGVNDANLRFTNRIINRDRPDSARY